MEDFEEVNFSHEGKEYYAKIEIDESNEWESWMFMSSMNLKFGKKWKL